MAGERGENIATHREKLADVVRHLKNGSDLQFRTDSAYAQSIIWARNRIEQLELENENLRKILDQKQSRLDDALRPARKFRELWLIAILRGVVLSCVIVLEKLMSSASPYVVGKFYLIRTCTMTLAGELVAVYDKELLLKNAAWITDTGRFSNVISLGEFYEVEPFGDRGVIVGRVAIVDATTIDSLPTVQT